MFNFSINISEWQPGQPTDNGPSYKWDNVPDADRGEDDDSDNEDAVKPPTDGFEAISGYDNVGYDTRKYRHWQARGGCGKRRQYMKASKGNLSSGYDNYRLITVYLLLGVNK